MISGNCSQPDVFSNSNPKIVPQYLSQNLARVMKRAVRNHATALCPQRQRTVLDLLCVHTSPQNGMNRIHVVVLLRVGEI